jgi:ADP-heptose:LPS heptosyltransferase
MPSDQHAGSQRRGPALAHKIRTIAVVRALFLGDLLMTTPAWRALRRRFPRAEITLIGLPWAEEFVARVPHLIDRFVPFAGYPGIAELPYDPARTAAWLAEQRAYGYDLAIQMHGDGGTSNGLVAELGARATVGLARPGDERLDLAVPYPDDRNEVLRWLGLAAALGAPIGDGRLELCPTAADEARAAELLGAHGAGPLIGLHLGAKDPARRWPVQRFASLGAALRRCGARLVLTGGPADAALTAEAARQGLGPALDLAGKTDVGSFAAVVARLDLLITNDTGASHLASAMGTPSVVLFGPTRPAQFAPLDPERHVALDAQEHTPLGLYGAAALRALPVEPVLDAALAQLDRRRAAAADPAVPLATQAVGGGEALCVG